MVRKSVLRLGEIVRSTGVLSFYLYGISAIQVRVNMLQSNNAVLYKTRCTLYLNIIYIYISVILPPFIPSSTHPYVCADKKSTYLFKLILKFKLFWLSKTGTPPIFLLTGSIYVLLTNANLYFLRKVYFSPPLSKYISK